jgi:hypothetical protein
MFEEASLLVANSAAKAAVAVASGNTGFMLCGASTGP